MATETKKLSALTEVITVNDNDYLLIVQNGDSKKVQAGKLKGAKNLSEEYVDLVSTDNTDKKFRMILRDDGEPIVYPMEVFTAEGWKQGDNLNVPFKTAAGSGMAKVATADIETLFINQMYGGGTGTAGTVETSVSHSFVELYNNIEVFNNAFRECTQLQKLELDVSKAITMDYMCYGDSALSTIILNFLRPL